MERESPRSARPEVVVDGVEYVPRIEAESRLLTALVCLYERDARVCAALCDDTLDKTGRLLGAVRIAFTNKRKAAERV